MNLSANTKITQVLGYTAAGQTKKTSDIIDMQGYDGCLFIVELGTILATGTLDAFVEQNSANSTSGMARLATTTLVTVDATSAAYAKSCILVDVYQPQKRYLQCNITPAVANAVILGITAIQYSGKAKPAGNVSATTLKSTLLFGAEEA